MIIQDFFKKHNYAVLSLLPTPYDAKVVNYYIKGDKLVIEDIPTYLNRVKGKLRAPASIVAVIVPKEGFNNYVEYSLENVEQELTGFSHKFYAFLGGVRDEDFKEIVVKGDKGDPGISSYELAVQNGFQGTVIDWLISLHGIDGRSAYQVATDNGFEGTVIEWLASLKGNDGKSAYDIAVENGFVGTEEQWLLSLIGDAGQSAYIYLAYASDNQGSNFTNIFDANLDYIAIKATITPIANPTANDFTNLWKKYKGTDGISAYQVWLTLGNVGTTQDFINSLKGVKGDNAIYSNEDREWGIGDIVTGKQIGRAHV